MTSATIIEHPSQNLSVPGAPLREAPSNLEAEQALLGAILLNNEALNHVGSSLTPEHFYAELHQRIFRAIRQFNDRGLIANPVTLKHHFASGEALEDQYLARLVASATAIINVAEYSELIRDLSLKRQLIGVGESMVNRAYVTPSDMSGIEQLEHAEQTLFTLATEGDAEGDFKPLSFSVGEAIKRTERAFKHADTVVGVSTGFTDLDKVLGGLHESDLLILAGRPSMGKTALATNIAYNSAKWLSEQDREKINLNEKPRTVGFFSLEMSAEQLAMRILASEAKIPSHKLMRGDLNNEQFLDLARHQQSMSRMPFFIDDTPALSISALRSRARRLKRVHNLSVLVIDYLQLVRPSSGGSNVNRVQEISEITQGLKAIAKELQIPVIALSQLSRAVEQREDKRPQLSDLRESGSIEQDADVVMFVFREEYYVKREQPSISDDVKFAQWQAACEKVHGKAEVIIAKHRNGPILNVEMGFNADHTQFHDKDWQNLASHAHD
jgi:replicative DNA helicase